MKKELQWLAMSIVSIHLKHIGNAFECFLSMSQDRLHKSEIYIVQNCHELSF